MITRIADEDVILGNKFLIKKGERVSCSIATLLRDPKNFPEPDKFDVERWLDEEKIKQNNHLAFIPFSAGPRNCIG